MSFEVLRTFLLDRLRSCDALLIECTAVHGQDVRAKVRKAYASKNEGPEKYSRGDLSFVGTPGHWGSPTLQTSDRAIAFIGYIASSGRYYQHPWRGHFLVEEMGGLEFAIAPWNSRASIWRTQDSQEQCLIPDPARPWRVAVPLTLLEQYLASAIRDLDDSPA